MRLSLFAAAALCVSCLNARATVIATYTSQSAYDAATYSNAVINFSDLTPPNGYTYLVPPTVTDGGATFFVNTSISDSAFYEQNPYPGLQSGVNSDTYVSAQGAEHGGNNLTIDFPDPVTAFSLTLNSLIEKGGITTGVPDPLVLTFSDQTMIPLTIPATSYSFIGFTSSDEISSVSIEDSGPPGVSAINLAQIEVGSRTPPVAVTPEPSSFALLGTGLLGVAGVLRKRFA